MSSPSQRRFGEGHRHGRHGGYRHCLSECERAMTGGCAIPATSRRRTGPRLRRRATTHGLEAAKPQSTADCPNCFERRTLSSCHPELHRFFVAIAPAHRQPVEEQQDRLPNCSRHVRARYLHGRSRWTTGGRPSSGRVAITIERGRRHTVAQAHTDVSERRSRIVVPTPSSRRQPRGRGSRLPANRPTCSSRPAQRVSRHALR
jgi:hypothetical protein